MNDGTFKVGEIGILRNLTDWPGKYNGEEALVVGGLEIRLMRFLRGNIGYGMSYVIHIDGQDFSVNPSNLRKKPPRITVEPKQLELEDA